MNNQKFIRNFAIIAHIDHGKSTLADRLIEYCGGLTAREMTMQVLDSMPLEQERGITIKAQTVRLAYNALDGNTYYLNLMDTPGHVDFAYEVSRSLAACEGSILVVDSTQGVEAQTLANVYQAIENNHTIITVLNKIDLAASDIEKSKNQIQEIIGIDAQESILISAKNGIGIGNLLEEIVKKLPAPSYNLSTELKALLVDSWYDSFLGVVILVRIMDGTLTENSKIRMISTNSTYQVENVGYFTPKKQITKKLGPGEIGFFTAGIKQVSDCKVGDTIVDIKNSDVTPLPGFKSHLPVVFCGLYPNDISEFDQLKIALAKLQLNDGSFVFEQESSCALGLGFRCGFLGLLHLEITQERLFREFGLDVLITSPSVLYEINTRDGETIKIHNPKDLPNSQNIVNILEPWVSATIFTPDEFLGDILELCTKKRGVQIQLTYTLNRTMLIYKLPLNEIVFDFYDKIKSYSKGYASFEWNLKCYEESDLVKLTILVNHEPVDALSSLVHRSQAEYKGRALCKSLSNLIPKQLFPIAIQAAIGNRIIARETIKAIRKDVLSKCYGGDITRKRKLLEKQKAGKRKMSNIGNVEIPHSVFISALKLQNN